MAQFSWTILESKSASLHKALKAVEKCKQEILQTLYSSSHKTRILSQLDTFSHSLVEILDKPLFKQFTEELPSIYFIKTIGVVQLHPSYLGNVKNGVYSYLSNFLMHYNEDFKGVWISCGSFKPLDSLGYLTTGDSQGIISFRISLRVLVFVPKLDLILGKITRIRPRSISVLTYGIFNVTIKPENLPNVKQEGSAYNIKFADKTVTEDSLVTLKLISVTVLRKNKWLNLSAKLEDDLVTG